MTLMSRRSSGVPLSFGPFFHSSAWAFFFGFIPRDILLGFHSLFGGASVLDARMGVVSLSIVLRA
jgi:hypothetical protein